MPAQLVVAKKVNKDFIKLPRHIQAKIIAAYGRMASVPISGVKLHGELAAYYKYRVGDYRIVYKFDVHEKLIQVVKIEHRQGVYK
ncbi:MAG TPA: type II toxin-antitoxin system RelE/ParE family toxin [Alphaproteobacteria bacterium]|jgi:mRNA interferase RelE/StbE|nr:type II toxin-antitoxin system RelE/ParE family toxin [Alphaproteobacteria bacterium]